MHARDRTREGNARVDRAPRSGQPDNVHAVVIDRVTGDGEQIARALAQALGCTPYDVRASANAPGGGPAVVSVHADPKAAEATCALVRGAGVTAHVVAVRAIELLEARKFELGPTALGVENREGVAVQIPYAAIDLLLRGARQIQRTQTETVTQKNVAIDRMILSGGLINTRTQETTRTTTQTDADELVVVFAGAETPWVLRERELVYQSLGPALQPSRTANFRFLTGELRSRAPQATWDERLVRPANQSQMLGRMLRVEEHLEFLVGLVAASVRASGGPYRSPGGGP
jgi:hypothetical protein